MPTGGLRPRIKCGAAKLTSDRATAKRHKPPIALVESETSTASRSRAAPCSVVWGFGFRRTGLWARPRSGALGGALVMHMSLCPEKSGPGLCFLPRNFPEWEWPWNPAYRQRIVKAVDGRQAAKSSRWLFSRNFDWIAQAQVSPQHAIKAALVLCSLRPDSLLEKQ
jgi:hypothetical protein